MSAFIRRLVTSAALAIALTGAGAAAQVGTVIGSAGGCQTFGLPLS